jgi:hypothetical protein
MADATSRMQDAMETSRERIAEGLRASADAVCNAATSLPLSEKMGRFLGKTAGRLNRSAAYVGEHNTGEMLEDARSVVRRNPGPSLLVAAAIGAAIGWTLRE